jgi:hypothetical protein
VFDKDAWISRADAVLTKSDFAGNASELMQFATSFVAALYGPESPQMRTLRDGADGIYRAGSGMEHRLTQHASATIINAKAELEAGLTGNVRALICGENLAELIALARDVLSENFDSAKNVGAVLVAAAFEDLIRRMGAEFAGVADRPKLEKVIGILKKNEVLKGGEPTTALSYLKFRNDSLHADWGKVERSQIHSCLAFVEQLLIKHFS